MGKKMIVALVIPCYKVKQHILSVLSKVGPEVSYIYVVDDHCPEGTGKYVEEHSADGRVSIIYNPENMGVGGATKAGYKRALEDGAEVIVKIDGDGQMDPGLIPRFIRPMAEGEADYTKGNRFYSLESLAEMPRVRVFGNALLSFLAKLTNGYWNLMDPTNGYTAIQESVLRMLPLEKIDSGYFFENDMLFRLNTMRAVVREIPIDAVYRDEKSNMKIGQILRAFPGKHMLRFFKRVYYNYFLRDFNICSIEILSSAALITFGTIFGMVHWFWSITRDITATTGTVMLAALPVILGFQMLLAAVHYDVMNVPNDPISRSFEPHRPDNRQEGENLAKHI